MPANMDASEHRRDYIGQPWMHPLVAPDGIKWTVQQWHSWGNQWNAAQWLQWGWLKYHGGWYRIPPVPLASDLQPATLSGLLAELGAQCAMAAAPQPADPTTLSSSDYTQDRLHCSQASTTGSITATDYGTRGMEALQASTTTREARDRSRSNRRRVLCQIIATKSWT
jgi:hypothetical protein